MSKRVASLAFCLLAACGGDTESRSCTAAACFNGLRVALTNPPNGAFRVEASAPGDPAIHAIDCASAQACILFLRDYLPDQVTIRVIAASGTTTFDASPTYGFIFPNGPDCGGECRQGTVTVP